MRLVLEPMPRASRGIQVSAGSKSIDYLVGVGNPFRSFMDFQASSPWGSRTRRGSLFVGREAQRWTFRFVGLQNRSHSLLSVNCSDFVGCRDIVIALTPPVMRSTEPHSDQLSFLPLNSTRTVSMLSMRAGNAKPVTVRSSKVTTSPILVTGSGLLSLLSRFRSRLVTPPSQDRVRIP